MEGLKNLIQQGGGDAMNMINNQSGGAAAIVFQIIWIAIPIIFFLVYYFWHLGLDNERAEIKKDDEGYEYRDYVIWGKFSLKVLLMMMALCYFFKDVLGWVIVKLPKETLNPGGSLTGYYWTVMFYLMIISGALTIIFGGLKSTAYQYFVDDLYDDRTKMKQVCVDFGCGYAPHGDGQVTRGDKV